MADKSTTTETTADNPGCTLVVIHPFGDYRRGDAITEPADIADVLAGPNAHHCNRIAK